jgi:hypothetical protein
MSAAGPIRIKEHPDEPRRISQNRYGRIRSYCGRLTARLRRRLRRGIAQELPEIGHDDVRAMVGQ